MARDCSRAFGLLLVGARLLRSRWRSHRCRQHLDLPTVSLLGIDSCPGAFCDIVFNRLLAATAPEALKVKTSAAGATNRILHSPQVPANPLLNPVSSPAENHLRRNARLRRQRHPDLLPGSSLQPPHQISADVCRITSGYLTSRAGSCGAEIRPKF